MEGANNAEKQAQVVMVVPKNEAENIERIETSARGPTTRVSNMNLVKCIETTARGPTNYVSNYEDKICENHCQMTQFRSVPTSGIDHIEARARGPTFYFPVTPQLV